MKKSGPDGGGNDGAAGLVELVEVLETSGGAALVSMLKAGWRRRLRTWVGLSGLGTIALLPALFLIQEGNPLLLWALLGLWPAIVVREMVHELSSPGERSDRWMPSIEGSHLLSAALAWCGVCGALVAWFALMGFGLRLGWTGRGLVSALATMGAVIGGLVGPVQAVKVWFRTLVALGLHRDALRPALAEALGVSADREFKAQSLKDQGLEVLTLGIFVGGLPLSLAIGAMIEQVLSMVGAAELGALLGAGVALLVAGVLSQAVLQVLAASEVIALARGARARRIGEAGR